MSYIAFELSALETAPDMARAAGIPEDTAIAGLVRMWAWCWRAKTDVVHPVALRGFFGTDAVDALSAFGFLDTTGQSIRVKGAERYLRIVEARRENGKRAAAGGNLKRGGRGKTTLPDSPTALQQLSSSSPVAIGALLESVSNSSPALSSSIEHRIEEESLPPPVETLSVGRRLPSVAPTPETAAAELEGDGQGGFPPTGLGFCGWWQSERRQRGLTTEYFAIPEVVAFHDSCVQEVGLPRFQAAAVAYFEDEYFRARGWPIRVFMSPLVWRPRANEQPKKWVKL